MKEKVKTKSIKTFFKNRFSKKGFVKAYDDISLLTDIAIIIAKARGQVGLSQVDFAKKLKTSQSVISRIENGNQNLSVKMLAKIAQVLSCELSVQLKPLKLVA